jgi:AAA15 family ATPase/GTPase
LEETLFLKEVSLSGYKSIQDVRIELMKGLNIVIGKNAAGKTNFLRFLHKSLSLDFDELNNFSSSLIFQNGKKISLRISRHFVAEDLFKQANFNSSVDAVLKIDNKTYKDRKTTISEKLIEHEVRFNSTFVCHGIPGEYFIVDKPFSYKSEKGKLSDDLSRLFRDPKIPYFVRTTCIDLFFLTYNAEYTTENITLRVNDLFKKIERLSEILSRYTPIEELRFSENFNVFVDSENQTFTLNNLFIEFKVDGNWLPFSNLSDGTKRLFYIVSEVFDKAEIARIRPSGSGYFYDTTDVSRIVLIEEPELGIHPHQFLKLMKFLIEESGSKQIILTTHSPQSLDSLEESELSRIIIAYSSNEVGTKLRRLNENELLKAGEYIKDDFLSDYWLYSDLEK